MQAFKKDKIFCLSHSKCSKSLIIEYVKKCYKLSGIENNCECTHHMKTEVNEKENPNSI
jgi:hypothetical protein